MLPNNSETDVDLKQAEERQKFFWFEKSVSHGARLLVIVRKAAVLSAVPSLKAAACITLAIIRKIGATQGITVELRGLGEDAATFIAAIFRSYRRADDPLRWPGTKDQMVLEDLVKLLGCIESFVDGQIEIEINTSTQILQGGKQSLEYREGLASLVLDHLQCIQSYKMPRDGDKIYKYVMDFEEDLRVMPTSIGCTAKENGYSSLKFAGSQTHRFCIRCEGENKSRTEEGEGDELFSEIARMNGYRYRRGRTPQEMIGPYSKAKQPTATQPDTVCNNLPWGLGRNLNGFTNGFISPTPVLPLMVVAPNWYLPALPLYQAQHGGMYMVAPLAFPTCNLIPAFSRPN